MGFGRRRRGGGGEGKGLMANECMTTPQLWNGKMCGKFIGSNEIPGFYLMPTIISDISKFGLLMVLVCTHAWYIMMC